MAARYANEMDARLADRALKCKLATIILLALLWPAEVCGRSADVPRKRILFGGDLSRSLVGRLRLRLRLRLWLGSAQVRAPRIFPIGG